MNVSRSIKFTAILLMTSIITYLVRKYKDFHSLSREDLFISVKTCQKNHQLRVKLILDTWFTNAKESVWFYTDKPDKKLMQLTGNK